MSLLENTKALQQRPSQIRNICILAHVDHGKTTLSDCLIASNGIISQRLAGQLRYLDSREDEQSRGITMQSSAISLLFVDPREKRRLARQAIKDNTPPATPVPYLINLIDSPGHVDFSSDVSTAVRLCDGALVVVDAVEGVCIQTQAVLRQAWEEGVKPCLVINKIDRLIHEIYLTPLEAFHHLRQIIEKVNALVSQMSNAAAFAKEDSQLKVNKNGGGNNSSSNNIDNSTSIADEEKAASMLFDPIKGNVIFASAIHGWGFSLGPFATLLSKKLNVNRAMLLKHLWGDYYYNPNKKSVTSKQSIATTKNNKKITLLPMVAKYILEPIWMMYNTVLVDIKPKKAKRMATALNIDVSAINEKTLKSPDLLIRTIMKSWLSLSNSILSCAVTHMPNPVEAQQKRCDRLFPKRTIPKSLQDEMGKSRMKEWNDIHESVRNCSSTGPLVAFVSKMIAVPRSDLPEEIRLKMNNNDNDATSSSSSSSSSSGEGQQTAVDTEGNQSSNNDAMAFVAFARVFSGTLTTNQPLCVMGPKYDPFSKRMRPLLLQKDNGRRNDTGNTDGESKDFQDLQDSKDSKGSNDSNDSTNNPYVREVHHCSKASNNVIQPMLMMGSAFELVESVGPGNIIAIYGLGNHILKTATLSTTFMSPIFSEMSQQATPILSVAIEPTDIQQSNALRRGLAMLNHADPCVEITLSSQGEMVMYCLGELHLERCLEDLKKRFAMGIPFEVSPPLVRFRETIVLEEHGSGGNGNGSGGSSSNSVEEMMNVNGSSVNNKNKVTMATPNGQVEITVSCEPMDESIVRLIEQYESMNKKVSGEEDNGGTNTSVAFLKELKLRMCGREDQDDSGNGNSSQRKRKQMDDDYDNICAFGPNQFGTNMLLNDMNERMDWSITTSNTSNTSNTSSTTSTRSTEEGDEKERKTCTTNQRLEQHRTSLINGFQLATEHGPMCEEPMWGVLYRIHAVTFLDALQKTEDRHQEMHIDNAEDCSKDHSENRSEESASLLSTTPPPPPSTISPPRSSSPTHLPTPTPSSTPATPPPPTPPPPPPTTTSAANPYGPLSGQIISTMRRACRESFKLSNQRLVEAVFECNMQCTMDQLGKLYSVLGQRRCEILQEDMMEGTSIFTVKGRIPVAETVGMADHMRKETSGGVSAPQLHFDRWQRLDIDPYFQPKTEEEREEFGEVQFDNQRRNRAKEYIDQTRERKGLSSNKKIVVDAEKQRTIGRNK